MRYTIGTLFRDITNHATPTKSPHPGNDGKIELPWHRPTDYGMQTPTIDKLTSGKGVVLLDGGMGQELRKRATKDAKSLWPAEVLLDAPNLVQQVHEHYLRAGAEIITTNTYATVKRRLEEKTSIANRFEKLVQRAGELANHARRNVNPSALIAGSLPPLHGSYRPDLVQPEAEMARVYAKHVDLLTPYVDLFLCETMSNAIEGRTAARIAKDSGKPVIVSWTLRDGPESDNTVKLRSGETITEAFSAVADLDVWAALLNCCWPESITLAASEMNTLPVRAWGGYANGFTVIPEKWTIGSGVTKLGQRKDLGPIQYLDHCKNWIDCGANLIGGCCEIGPDHISVISNYLKQQQA